jgi:hypothetical protein
VKSIVCEFAILMVAIGITEMAMQGVERFIRNVKSLQHPSCVCSDPDCVRRKKGAPQ